MKLRLMICLARSGGTLLNQCLGMLPRVVMLSEVNPLGGGWGALGPDSHTTPQAQAWHWYGIRLGRKGYSEAMAELLDHCKQRGKHLVVRDWTHVNFFQHPGMPAPSETLMNLEVLCENMPVQPFAFVRNPLDVWISRGFPPAGDFFRQMNRYGKALVDRGIEVFTYEEFCQKPEPTMQRLCHFLDLPYDEGFRNFHLNTKVNGDIRHPKGRPSRGRLEHGISVLPDLPLPEERQQELLDCEAYQGLHPVFNNTTRNQSRLIATK